MKNTESKITGGKIQEVFPSSIAEDLGLQPGDLILSINGKKLDDILDYQYLVCEEELEVEAFVSGELCIFEIEKDPDEDLGIAFEEPLFSSLRQCANNCLFCFVRQLPKQMRKTLYVRDDDYRFSFLYGNYITLTNLKEKDWEKIANYQLSPLYVSIHSLNPELRATLMGTKEAGNINQSLKRLLDAKIELYTQAVCCPGYNDGEDLKSTAERLADSFPQIRAFGIVPVGLTDFHSRGLRLHSKEEAIAVLSILEPLQKELFEKLGAPFLQIADEFYLRAGKTPPDARYYGNYELLENGIGAIRQFLDDFKECYNPKRKWRQNSLGIITGVAAETMFQQYVFPKLTEQHRQRLRLHPVINYTLGTSITVSGLMCGNDIAKILEKSEFREFILPSNCLKYEEDCFLDDITVPQLEEKYQVKIHVLEPEAEAWIEFMEEC
jgi:putative radical SAM enzyme (TIGR03279 family)